MDKKLDVKSYKSPLEKVIEESAQPPLRFEELIALKAGYWQKLYGLLNGDVSLETSDPISLQAKFEAFAHSATEQEWREFESVIIFILEILSRQLQMITKYRLSEEVQTPIKSGASDHFSDFESRSILQVYNQYISPKLASG